MLAPYWDDQVTFNSGEGIFTTTTGTAPNRVFYVEYRTEDFGDGVPLNYEIALYENGSPPFQYIYNTVTADPFGNDSALVVGVKQDNVIFTQYGCDATGGISPPVSSGQQLTASYVPCPGSPTPTPTASPTPTCPIGDYTITTTSGTIVPGTTDSGNHADDGITNIGLPFPVTFYDQSFTSVNICSNGNLQFTSSNSTFTNACLPTATMNGLIARTGTTCTMWTPPVGRVYSLRPVGPRPTASSTSSSGNSSAAQVGRQSSISKCAFTRIRPTSRSFMAP